MLVDNMLCFTLKSDSCVDYTIMKSRFKPGTGRLRSAHAVSDDLLKKGTHPVYVGASPFWGQQEATFMLAPL